MNAIEQNKLFTEALDEATRAVDQNPENGAQEVLDAGVPVYYMKGVDGVDILVKEYPSGRLEELQPNDKGQEIVIRVIKE